MLFEDSGRTYFRGQMLLLDTDVDYSELARRFQALDDLSAVFLVPQRARIDNGVVLLRFTGAASRRSVLPSRRPGRSHRADGDNREALGDEFIPTLISDLEDWFDAVVEIELIDLSQNGEFVLDDCDAILEVRKRSHSFFRPKPITADDLIPDGCFIDCDAMSDLDAMIGLEDVKNQIYKIVSLVEKSGRDNLPCLHMVFRGNPGTGKTTVARIIGRIFGELGVIENRGIFVEADRERLVGRFVGSTAPRTKAVIKEAKGGVLFIDEAYALGQSTAATIDYGAEALAVLVKEMEDARNDFVCIMAGYSEPMDKMINVNPGLRDRIGFYIDFPDYSASELFEVFEKFAHDEAFELTPSAADFLEDAFVQIENAKDDNFSNGRLVRKIWERTKMNHIVAADMNDPIITLEDCEEAFADNDLAALISAGTSSVRMGFC